MSWFTVGGNLGIALGPVVVTPVLLATRLHGTPLLALPALVMAAVLAVRRPWRVAAGPPSRGVSASAGRADDWRGFARLSAASRQMRFLGVKKELSAAELRYFTDVDHHDHEALGALDHADGRGVGVARYVRDTEDPQAAEIAVTIIDDWQGRGLGTELLAQLSDRARQ